MTREFDVRDVEASDREPFSADEIAQLASLHLLPSWPALRSVFLRFQSRALDVITSPASTVEQIREAQGRLDNARMTLDLLETDAPRRYKEATERDEHDDDDPS